MTALALGLLAGSWWQLQQAVLLGPVVELWLMALALLGALASFWQRPSSPKLAWLLALLAAALIAASAADWRSQQRLAGRLPAFASGQLRTLDGVIVDLPAVDPDGVRFVFAPLDPTLPRLQLSWPLSHGAAPQPFPQPGQIWRLPLRLKAVHGVANPFGSDSEWRAFERGIGGSASVSRAQALPAPRYLGLSSQAATWLPRLRAWLRTRMRDGLAGSEQAGSMVALALGDQAAIGAPDWALYRATGVAHLVSISGLHITLLAALAGRAVGTAWRRVRWRGRAAPLLLATPDLVWLARVSAATAYALLAGFGVPAQRAWMMLLVGAALRSRGLASPWWQSMAWALAAVLAWDPWAVLAPGFWLSFGAVAMLFVADGAAAGDEVVESGWRRRLCQLRAAARAQLALSLALAPATLLFFQQTAWVGPLANALAIPLVTLWAVPLALLGLLLPAPLAAGCWTLGALALQIMHAALERLAAWPQPSYGLAAPDALGLVLALLGSVVLALDWGWRLRLGGILLLLPVFAHPARAPRSGHVEAWVADVGQGSAVLVRTARHALLFDAGPAPSPGQDAGTRVLVPLLRGLGLARLDLLVLSHADNDHIGGAAAVVHAFARPPALASVPATRLRQIGLAQTQPCVAGQRWNWDGVEFRVLHPLRADDGARHSNAASCVLHVASRHGSLLLTGDIMRAQERALAHAGLLPHADLLLAPHHGSATSSSSALLDAVRPRAIAIQVGYANAYAHPNPLVLSRLLASGAALYRSDRDGALRWRDDDPSRLCGWRASHRRYWQQDWPGGPGGQGRGCDLP